MKRVLVTGAASGIGAGTAAALRDQGWEVVGADLKPDGDLLELDVAEETAWDAAMEAAGPVDALVNCAGFRSRAPLVELEVAEFDRMLAVHVRGTFLGIRACARQWLRDGRPGAVVAISSVTGTHAVAGQPHYVAAKAGIAGLVRAAAVELAPSGVRVNAIAPGIIATPMTADRLGDPAQRAWLTGRVPAGEHGEVADIAAAAVYLLSDAARYVNGVVLPVDGGWTAC
ncbi:MAG: SDR family oxidoreductase [Pseudonocardia sp.]|uniref:SDR family NAD(P)-dependent oxidoreductase n=1 Tax=Pseudonocardia sp. TaxID=60912 RepID=UPI001AD49482|nr:SDR family NAD(P)-dependent oxidoreductase [Pseudonocardia sp.]MBN9098612.1 SDR family oxidoreductase [Pseudonocardia sp.]